MIIVRELTDNANYADRADADRTVQQKMRGNVAMWQSGNVKKVVHG